MADSLVLTGVKDVKKHTGTEMLLTRPKRGGDTHSLKEWWKAGGKCYTDCTVFDVTTPAGTVKLAIDSGYGTNLRIDHDGDFNFLFYGSNEVSRAALFNTAFELIEHYVFPRISGGKIMTVTPAEGALRPDQSFIGDVNVTGASTSTDGSTETYSAGINGSAGGLSFSWSVSGDAVPNGSTTGLTFDIDVSTGNAVVTCIISSSDAGVTDSPVTGTLAVTIS